MSKSQVEIQENRIKLTSGKELTLVNILSFCYDFSETDVNILLTLTRSEPKGTEELEQELNLSKASINRSLNKLLELGMVMRVKESGNKAGRPRYLYKAISMEELRNKILNEIKECISSLIKVVDESLA